MDNPSYLFTFTSTGATPQPNIRNSSLSRKCTHFVVYQCQQLFIVVWVKSRGVPSKAYMGGSTLRFKLSLFYISFLTGKVTLSNMVGTTFTDLQQAHYVAFLCTQMTQLRKGVGTILHLHPCAAESSKCIENF